MHRTDSIPRGLKIDQAAVDQHHQADEDARRRAQIAEEEARQSAVQETAQIREELERYRAILQELNSKKYLAKVLAPRLQERPLGTRIVCRLHEQTGVDPDSLGIDWVLEQYQPPTEHAHVRLCLILILRREIDQSYTFRFQVAVELLAARGLSSSDLHARARVAAYTLSAESEHLWNGKRAEPDNSGLHAFLLTLTHAVPEPETCVERSINKLLRT